MRRGWLQLLVVVAGLIFLTWGRAAGSEGEVFLIGEKEGTKRVPCFGEVCNDEFGLGCGEWENGAVIEVSAALESSEFPRGICGDRRLVLRFWVPESGFYNLRIGWWTQQTGDVIRLFLNSEYLGKIESVEGDDRAQTVFPFRAKTAGEVELAFEGEGGDGVGLDFIGVWPVDSKESRLLFSSHFQTQDGTGEIYLADDEGEEVIRLTKNQVDDWDPVFSPSGEKIAFVSGKRESRLKIMDREGEMVEELPVRGSRPYWLDEDSLAYYSACEVGSCVYLYDLKKGEEKLLVTDGHHAAFSFDGKRMVFVRGDPPGGRVVLANSRGEEEKVISLVSCARRPVFSPDGEWVYYFAKENEEDCHSPEKHYQVYAYSLSTGETLRVTGQTWADNVQPCVAAKGRLFFASNRGVPGSLSWKKTLDLYGRDLEEERSFRLSFWREETMDCYVGFFPGDLDWDGERGTRDAKVMLSGWGGGFYRADFNGDGKVNGWDFARGRGYWGRGRV